MDHYSPNSSQPPTSSDYSLTTTPRMIFLHPNTDWNPPSPIRSNSQGLKSAFLLNRPRPMAASEAPVTLIDAIRKVNHHVLRSCALLAHGEPDEALEEADYALYLAEARKIYHLQSKSQLYRGKCLMGLGRWEEASAAFTRAANVRGWAERITELKFQAERSIVEAEKRRVSKRKQIGDLWGLHGQD